MIMTSGKLILGLCLWARLSEAFVPPSQQTKAKPEHHNVCNSSADHRQRHHNNNKQALLMATAGTEDIEYLKIQLLEYLDKRKEIGADDLAEGSVGKVIGGTKGNAVLNFVSGSPNKERVVEKAPDPLDYGELTKYGFGHLVTPIMNAGGRFEMYRILELEAPETRRALKRISAPEVVVENEELNVPKRYTGLKLGQVLDDDMQGAALAESYKKDDSVGSTDVSSDYIMPFSDKRNTGPRPTPEWTAERLDELGRSRGRAEAWAQRARAGEFVKDTNESLELTLQQRAFSILTALLIATAFGKSTDTFFVDMVKLVPDQDTIILVKDVLRGPAFGLFVASIASCVLSFVQASERNRNSVVWAIKGALGGPFTVSLLRSLDPLITREEEEAQKKA